MNNDLRLRIVETIKAAGEGHIPSSFSVVDIIDIIYASFLRYKNQEPEWLDRDYFILSKGHAAAGFFVVLEKYGFLSAEMMAEYGTYKGILGGHPDRTKVPGAEASTGSLGHGFPFAMGIALGLKVQKKENKVIALVGDGECHEGTIWETALVAQNNKLNNLCVIVDLNGSAEQILPHPNISKQFTAFGWDSLEIDGHDKDDISGALKHFYTGKNIRPLVIIAKTVKGKGVSFMETHGPWHHKIPNDQEFELIKKELLP